MTLTITIHADNAALEGGQAGPEIARILSRLSQALMRDGALDEGRHILRDTNGNKVGHAEVTA